MNIGAAVAAALLAVPPSAARPPATVPSAAARPLAWGDQGDGTYRNPILSADYSDPDVIRVGDDFYLVASDFHFVGIQVLHSRDLVNWRIVGQVFDRLTMSPKYDAMQGYAQGTWAPSLRYHDGLFYLYVCTPYDGLFLWTARRPEGPWSDTITVKAVEGWEDPNPFWDDDGSAYLVHGQKGAGPLILHKMSADGTRLLDDGVEIYRGPVAEGPKLFKRHGWYYISLPEGGVEKGGQTVLRARELYGPYERRQVLPDGSPHQGGIVELASGESWFIGFKSTGHLGRVSHLLPVRWTDDDWPVFGDGGRAVERWKKPAAGGGPIRHPQTSDDFEASTLPPQWQWNHNPVVGAWSLSERRGWLRLRPQPAPALTLARDTLTQKLWGPRGTVEVTLDARGLAEGQRAGFAFMSGKIFSPIGVVRDKGALHLYWEGGPGPILSQPTIRLRGVYEGDAARLSYSADAGLTWIDSGERVALTFGQWKGARVALFAYGDGGGAADFDDFVYGPGADAPIDRQALVTRHDPTLTRVDYSAPLTLGNGGFAFTADITGLQSFSDAYYREGIPLETLSRWCWVTEEAPRAYTLAEADAPYSLPDGRIESFPTRTDGPAADWLRRNPHDHPLAQLALEWIKDDGSPLAPADVHAPHQVLDLWHGVIVSRYDLGGQAVEVTTAVDPASDTIAVRVDSKLVASGRLRVRLAFPRGHDLAVKNTPPLDWSHPESHTSRLAGDRIVERSVGSTRYFVAVDHALRRTGPHAFLIEGDAGRPTLAFSVSFAPRPLAAAPVAASVFQASAKSWPEFWRHAAALDLSGSTNPLAAKLEERVVLSQYLTAVQMAGAAPPQESGLTASTWYGKHHTEMIWWHAAHFALWGHPELLARNLEWYRDHLPDARALAKSRGLAGARWAKMVGPDDRESPGGNPLIAWNQPSPVYLSELLYRLHPDAATLARYRDLVLETAESLASMVWLDPRRDRYVLGPPLWIAQEIHDPATSQDPSFELAYWRWALSVAQRWRERLGLGRDAHWDDVIARLAALPTKDGKYVALESSPDTWDAVESRHDHPAMLMPLGFLPGGPDVDRATMDRTLDAVRSEWDWRTKIWGWDYPMIAMTATRLGRPDVAVEILLRDGPNNVYTASGLCPQRSDTASAGGGVPARKWEIAAYLPANGAFLSAVALMVAGWDGNTQRFPGFPADGTWTIRAEGWQPLP